MIKKKIREILVENPKRLLLLNIPMMIIGIWISLLIYLQETYNFFFQEEYRYVLLLLYLPPIIISFFAALIGQTLKEKVSYVVSSSILFLIYFISPLCTITSTSLGFFFLVIPLRLIFTAPLIVGLVIGLYSSYLFNNLQKITKERLLNIFIILTLMITMFFIYLEYPMLSFATSPKCIIESGGLDCGIFGCGDWATKRECEKDLTRWTNDYKYCYSTSCFYDKSVNSDTPEGCLRISSNIDRVFKHRCLRKTLTKEMYPEFCSNYEEINQCSFDFGVSFKDKTFCEKISHDTVLASHCWVLIGEQLTYSPIRYNDDEYSFEISYCDKVTDDNNHSTNACNLNVALKNNILIPPVCEDVCVEFITEFFLDYYKWCEDYKGEDYPDWCLNDPLAELKGATYYYLIENEFENKINN